MCLEPLSCDSRAHLFGVSSLPRVTHRGQTLREYREASKRYGDVGIISADDRILHCCLHLADQLGCGSGSGEGLPPPPGQLEVNSDPLSDQLECGSGSGEGPHPPPGAEGSAGAVQQKGSGRRNRLVLLSNDTMMRNKVRALTQFPVPCCHAMSHTHKV